MQWECSSTSPSIDSLGPLTLRLRGLIAAGPCLALLLAAACLHPRGSGYGTHEQLLLPPCGFLARTGWPCVTCGLTTSVSAMAHGQVGLALKAQPFGAVIFLAAVVLLTAGACQVLTGRDVLGRLRLGMGWAICGIMGLLGGWAWNLVVGAGTGQWPLH